MPNAFAAVASILWGTSDFLGGMSAKRLDVRRVGAVAEATGLVAIALILIVLPAHPNARDLILGAGAGIATALGVLMLYAALAFGPMYLAAYIMVVVGDMSHAAICFVVEL